jgi:hypothetical protein
MSAEELLTSTSGYDLQYTSRAPVMSPSPSPTVEDERISLREAIEDPHIWQHSRPGAQEEMEERIENLRLRTARLNRESSLRSAVRSERDRYRSRRQTAMDDDDMYGDNCDNTADDSYAGIVRISAPTPPPFTVTAASEEEESDSNEELPTAAVMADRLRRESRWRAGSDDDEEAGPRFGGLRRAPALSYTTYDEWRDRRDQHVEPIRATRIGTMSRLEPAEPLPQADNLIPPHAKFFIAKNKSKITIKFHPAMYVLLLNAICLCSHDVVLEDTSCSSFGALRMTATSTLKACSSMATRGRVTFLRCNHVEGNYVAEVNLVVA